MKAVVTIDGEPVEYERLERWCEQIDTTQPGDKSFSWKPGQYWSIVDLSRGVRLLFRGLVRSELMGSARVYAYSSANRVTE